MNLDLRIPIQLSNLLSNVISLRTKSVSLVLWLSFSRSVSDPRGSLSLTLFSKTPPYIKPGLSPTFSIHDLFYSNIFLCHHFFKYTLYSETETSWKKIFRVLRRDSTNGLSTFHLLKQRTGRQGSLTLNEVPTDRKGEPGVGWKDRHERIPDSTISTVIFLGPYFDFTSSYLVSTNQITGTVVVRVHTQ